VVYLRVGHDRESCGNGRTDRDGRLSDSRGLREPCIRLTGCILAPCNEYVGSNQSLLRRRCGLSLPLLVNFVFKH